MDKLKLTPKRREWLSVLADGGYIHKGLLKDKTDEIVKCFRSDAKDFFVKHELIYKTRIWGVRDEVYIITGECLKALKEKA